MKPLSLKIWEAWRVGGKGWAANDLQRWMKAAEDMERYIKMLEKQADAAKAREEGLCLAHGVYSIDEDNPDGGCKVCALEAKVAGLLKRARRLLDMHEFCPSCHRETAGQYGHTEDCPDWLALYPGTLPPVPLGILPEETLPDPDDFFTKE